MISISDIRKSYRMGDSTLEVLKGVSLTINDGDFVAIMGPSGSGKSTLMNILGMLDVPTDGSYLFCDVETSGMDEDQLAIVRRDHIGFVFQQFNLLPRLNAYENVVLPLLYSKKDDNYGYGKELLEKIGLGARLDHRPNELSGGQQQRVAIARSLINKPKIIFADEPTGNLDSQSEKDIMQALKDLHAEGITVVMVTHEEEIGQQASRLIRMRDGVVQSDERLKPLALREAEVFQHENTKNSLWDFSDYFVQGLKTLLANKGRTFLSMLGVLIGVAAVVTMLAVGRGAQQSMEKQLSNLGSNLLTVRPGAQRVGGVSQESSAANRLQIEDVELLAKHLEGVRNISGQVAGRGQATASGKNWNTYVQAVSASWAAMQNSSPVMGRFFTEQEVATRARVAVLGATVTKELFGEADPVGETIKINRVLFQVIGVLPYKGASGFRDQDDMIIIPVSTGMYRLFGKNYIDMLEVQVDRLNEMDSVTEQLEQELFKLRKIPLSQQEGAFNIMNMAEIKDAIMQSSQTMSLLLSAIAAISLIVGGIGIMNIMLVSVTERTKEIGLRKAVGARKHDILSQFLSESVVISVVGGVAGILVGIASSVLISKLLGWSTSVSMMSILVSFGFSVFIGVVFGVFPAQKASKMNPIEALRYE